MKQIKTKSGNIGIIEVPKLAFYFDWIEGKNGNIYIYWGTEDGRIEFIKTNFQKWSDFEILNKLSQLDKELDEFVDRNVIAKGEEIDGFVLKEDFIMGWKNYINNKTVQPYEFDTPKQSFISLVKSQHPEFQGDKEWLVIKLL